VSKNTVKEGERKNTYNFPLPCSFLQPSFAVEQEHLPNYRRGWHNTTRLCVPWPNAIHGYVLRHLPSPMASGTVSPRFCNPWTIPYTSMPLKQIKEIYWKWEMPGQWAGYSAVRDQERKQSRTEVKHQKWVFRENESKPYFWCYL